MTKHYVGFHVSAFTITRNATIPGIVHADGALAEDAGAAHLGRLIAKFVEVRSTAVTAACAIVSGSLCPAISLAMAANASTTVLSPRLDLPRAKNTGTTLSRMPAVLSHSAAVIPRRDFAEVLSPVANSVPNLGSSKLLVYS